VYTLGFSQHPLERLLEVMEWKLETEPEHAQILEWGVHLSHVAMGLEQRGNSEWFDVTEQTRSDSRGISKHIVVLEHTLTPSEVVGSR
jgi:hypothetical protein